MEDLYIKEQVESNEYMIARIAHQGLHVPTPEIVYYNSTCKVMIMTKILPCSVADYYGDADNKTPDEVYIKIRKIINDLLMAGISYPDITGYNFIEDKEGKVWIIDFGHAKVMDPNKMVDTFITKFLNGHNGWNPEFK